MIVVVPLLLFCVVFVFVLVLFVVVVFNVCPLESVWLCLCFFVSVLCLLNV